MFGNTLVTGGAGFLGSRLVYRLTQENLCSKIVVPRSAEYDLTSQSRVGALFLKYAPFDTIFHLAATVSGIGSQNPATYFYDNLQMGMNVIHLAYRSRASRIVVAGSVCAYPLSTSLPTSESSLWDGKPEPTNASYGIAKRALSTMLEAYNEQYGLRSAYLLLANLYGPGQDYSPQTSHVIPALIAKMRHDHLQVWGTGNATRDFLYVDDAVSALILAAQRANRPLPTNVASGKEISIRDLVSLLCDLLPYTGSVEYDTSKPDGQPRRLFSLERAKLLLPGWEPKVGLVEGLTETIKWFRNQ